MGGKTLPENGWCGAPWQARQLHVAERTPGWRAGTEGGERVGGAALYQRGASSLQLGAVRGSTDGVEGGVWSMNQV